MPADSDRRSSFPFAVVFIVVGVLLLFGNIGWYSIGALFELLVRWWPLIFIVRGISRLKGGSAAFGHGIRDLAFGGVMQLLMLGWISFDMTHYWPYVLIAMGLWLILVPAKDVVLKKEIDTSEFNETVFLRGAELRVIAPRLHGGRLRTTASLVECDLSAPEAGSSVVRLELHARLSRVRLHLSDNTRVTTELRNAAAVTDRRDLGNPPEGSDVPGLVIPGPLTLPTPEILDPPPADTNEEA